MIDEEPWSVFGVKVTIYDTYHHTSVMVRYISRYSYTSNPLDTEYFRVDWKGKSSCRHMLVAALFSYELKTQTTAHFAILTDMSAGNQ